MLNFENIFNSSVAFFLSCIGWIIRKLYSNYETLTKKLYQLEIKLPEKYLMKSDFKDFKEELFSRLDRIEGKIDKVN